MTTNHKTNHQANSTSSPSRITEHTGQGMVIYPNNQNMLMLHLSPPTQQQATNSGNAQPPLKTSNIQSFDIADYEQNLSPASKTKKKQHMLSTWTVLYNDLYLLHVQP